MLCWADSNVWSRVSYKFLFSSKISTWKLTLYTDQLKLLTAIIYVSIAIDRISSLTISIIFGQFIVIFQRRDYAQIVALIERLIRNFFFIKHTIIIRAYKRKLFLWKLETSFSRCLGKTLNLSMIVVIYREHYYYCLIYE